MGATGSHKPHIAACAMIDCDLQVALPNTIAWLDPLELELAQPEGYKPPPSGGILASTQRAESKVLKSDPQPSADDKDVLASAIFGSPFLAQTLFYHSHRVRNHS